MAAAAAAASDTQHAVHFAASTSPIKDDVGQLAACWKSWSGLLTRQEAGLLLWYHSSACGERAEEVLGAGVVTASLDVLASSAVLLAEKSTAAGLLLSLCADDKGKEQVAKSNSRTSAANGSASCCAVLHACLDNPAAAPRHVIALLACLASCPASLSVLLKALEVPPWRTYIQLLDHSRNSKDHATTIATASFIQSLTAQRGVLAADAAAAGVLQALLAATAGHKSAAAVCAGASCMLTMCLAAPELRAELGGLPGAVQIVVDLLGPPPATLIAWEQQQLKQQAQSPHRQPPTAQPLAGSSTAAGGAEPADQQQGRSPHHTTSSICAGGGAVSSASIGGQHVRLSELKPTGMMSRGCSRSGAVGGDDAESDGHGKEQQQAEEQQQTANRPRRKSLRILNVAEGELAALGGGPAAASCSSRAPSSAGDAMSPSHARSALGGKVPCLRSSAVFPPALRSPPLSLSSSALKWETPVPEATRAAAAGLLAQLVQLPHLCQAAADRLATPRLAELLTGCMLRLSDAPGKKGKSGSKKSGSSKLSVPPGSEQLLTHVCVALDLLVASGNADCYRVAAAAGCLPALVRLASESRHTQLRRAAKAVLAQVMMLAEAAAFVQQAAVPEELVVLQQGLMRLRDADIRQLLLEFPPPHAHPALQVLDEVTARARG